VTNPEHNHVRTDDTAVIVAFEPEHLPMAGHGLLDPGADDTPDDSLATELARAAPRRWWNRGTLVLGGLVLLLAGFLGGLQVQKNYGTPATGTGRGAGAVAGRGTGNFAGRGAGAYGGGSGFPGGAAPTAFAAAGTTGTVKLVDGDTIYVQTAAGDVVTVRTSGSTSVQTATKGTVSDVKVGDGVTVQGAAGSDGTVTATSVTAQRKK
jgi:hypothetical protein